MTSHATANDGEAEARRLADGTRRVWAGLIGRSRVFLVVFATTAMAVQLVGFFWPATYAARAALEIEKTRRSPQLGTETGESPTVTTAGVTEAEVNSEIALLTSREVLAATVASSGLDQIPPRWWKRIVFAPLRAYERLYATYHDVPYPSPTDRAIRGLANAISVERLKDSNVLGVSLRLGDPRIAEIVLSQFLKHYLEHHLRVHAREGAGHFFAAQVSVLAGELARHEDALQRLKRDLDATDPAAERDVQLKLDGTLREEATTVHRRLTELDARIEAYLASAVELPSRTRTQVTTRPRDMTLENLRAEALKLEMNQIRLDARYRHDSPLVVENREKLRIAWEALENQRRTIFEESTTAMDPTRLAVDQELTKLVAERAGLRERQRTLEAQLAASRARLVQFDQKTMESIRIQRLIKSTEDKYLMYLARVEKARIDAALDQGRFTNASVVQEPTASLSPVRPQRLVVLLVSVVGGSLAAAATCIGLELRRQGLPAVLASAAPRAVAP